MRSISPKLFVGALVMICLSCASQASDNSTVDSAPLPSLAALTQELSRTMQTAGTKVVRSTPVNAAPDARASLIAPSGGWADHYYPMHDGDWKTYAGAVQGRALSQRDDFGLDFWSGHFIQTEVFEGSIATLELSSGEGAIFLYRLTGGGSDVSFNPPIAFLADSMLPKGGKVTTDTIATMFGISLNMKCTMTASAKGTVSTPAGTYYDCNTLSMSLTAYVNGTTRTMSTVAVILAPGVGAVKSAVVQSGKTVGWMNLTDGRVGENSVNDIVFESVAPKLAITAPAKKAKLTNCVCQLSGTASDNVGITRVYCQANDAAWVEASGTNIWQCPLELHPGTNVLRAYATDACGNCSLTNAMNVYYSPMAPVAVRTNGTGTVSPVANGQWLEIGKSYTVKAIAKPGYLFGNWTDASGNVLTTNNVCNFIMASNAVVQANFIPDPFPPTKGDYAGLFYPATAASVRNSGFFQAKLTGTGAFSSKLTVDGQTVSRSGVFDRSLNTTLEIPRTGKSSLQVQIQIVDGNLVGSVSDSNGTSDLNAYRSTPASSGVGAYTLLVRRDGNSQDSPPGDGGATVTLVANGSVRVTGALADGTVITQSRAASQDGMWPLFSSLYKNRGLVIGWMKFDAAQTITTNTSVWLKSPAAASDKFYTNGFAQNCDVLLSRYTPPAAGQSCLSWINGIVEVALGNLAQNLTSQVVVSNNRVIVTGGSISNLVLTLSTKDGQFSGSMIHPATRKKTAFQGIFTPDYGGGWFLGTNQAGAIRFGPAP